MQWSRLYAACGTYAIFELVNVGMLLLAPLLAFCLILFSHLQATMLSVYVCVCAFVSGKWGLDSGTQFFTLQRTAVHTTALLFTLQRTALHTTAANEGWTEERSSSLYSIDVKGEGLHSTLNSTLNLTQHSTQHCLISGPNLQPSFWLKLTQPSGLHSSWLGLNLKPSFWLKLTQPSGLHFSWLAPTTCKYLVISSSMYNVQFRLKTKTLPELRTMKSTQKHTHTHTLPHTHTHTHTHTHLDPPAAYIGSCPCAHLHPGWRTWACAAASLAAQMCGPVMCVIVSVFATSTDWWKTMEGRVQGAWHRWTWEPVAFVWTCWRVSAKAHLAIQLTCTEARKRQ